MKNNKNGILLDLYKNSSFKIFLYPFITIRKSNEINKVFEANFNYEELKSILKVNDSEIIKFLYFNKDYVHQIFNEEEKIISIISLDENKRTISYNFYLSLLIMDNIDIVNYSFKIDYIRAINDYYRNSKDIYVLIIVSKIIIDLINSLKGTEIYDKKENEIELNSIIEERKNIINNNIYIFNEINLNIKTEDILSKKIDEIYIEIIKALFISKKIDDDSYISNIINQLDLTNINITQTIYNGIFELLNNFFIMSEYIISEEDDLDNEKKINFYFFLLKYILKNSIYIYQIPFLLITRNLFIKILKSNKPSNGYFIENNNDKLLYIIKTILDSDYYDEKINLIKLKKILNYYKEFLNEIKKKDIIIIENIINNNKKSSYDEYLKDYEKAKEMNLRLLIIKYLHSNSNKNNTFTDTIKNWSLIEKMIHEKNIGNIEDKYKDILIEYFKDINNKNYLLKIFTQDSINFLINHDKKINLAKKSTTISNIMIKKIDSLFNDIFYSDIYPREKENTLNYKEFLDLINKFEGEKDIKDIYNLKIESRINNIYNITFIFSDNYTNIQYKKENIFIHVKNTNLKDFENIIFIINNKNDKLIDKYHYKIYQNKLIKSFEFKNIKKIRNGDYLNWEEEKNYINSYDKFFNEIKSNNIEEIKEPILNILESPYNEDPNEDEFFDELTKKYIQFLHDDLEYMDLFQNKVINNLYKHKNLLKIGEDYIILISKKKTNDEDELLFYNINKKKIIKKINKYSFANTQNNFSLIKKKDQNKINFFCACNKSNLNQRNGILLLDSINIKQEIPQNFYNTEHFEPYCFCPLLIKDNNLFINEKDNCMYEKVYFLVGGFDLEESQGKIKIYKIVYSNKLRSNKIKYYKNIIFEDNKNINLYGNKITFISQSEDDGSILFFCNKKLYQFYLS